MSLTRKSVPSSTYSQERILSLNAPGEYEKFLADGELRPRLSRAVDVAELVRGEWLLDLGCGRGEVSANCVRRGARVLSLDYSEDCLQLTARAMREGKAVTGGRPSLVQADSKCIPVRDDSFSRILMLDVVEHLYPWELEMTLTEAYRVLKPGGRLIIHTLPNRWALGVGYRLARLMFRRLPPDPRSEEERTVHVNEQDILRLDRSLAKAGFRAFVWLEGSIAVHAKWQQGGKTFPQSDNRARVYPLLVNPVVLALYRLALATPLRLILANDIYAVAYKGSPSSGCRRGNWLERLVVGGVFRRKARGNGKR